MTTGLDHILLGTSDLERGIAWVEQLTGVRAAFGGVHPGRGTRNALLALGPDCYLEILAPDPEQSSPTWFPRILELTEPRLIAWAVHTPDIAALAQAAESAGFKSDGPRDGARTRADGSTLRWKLLHFRDEAESLLPFFIEWDRGAIHPAQDAPPGCRLEGFTVETPAAARLANAFPDLVLPVKIQAGKSSFIRALISTLKVKVELTS